MTDRIFKSIPRIVGILLIGLLPVLYNSCGVPKFQAGAGGTIMGNPLTTSLSIARYSGQVGNKAVNAVNICVQSLSLTPVNSGQSIQVPFESAQEFAVSEDGIELGELTIPSGAYSQIQLVLADVCGTLRSMGIVNSQGAFNTAQGVSLVFNGQITIDSDPKTITFEIQPIVNNLTQTSSDTDLVVQATTSPGTATLGNIWKAGPATINAPSPRQQPTVVWTGTQMIVWGGYNNSTWLNTGGVYDLATDTWTPTSTGANSPGAQWGSANAWTGSEFILWSGQGLLTDGSRFNPTTNQWTAMTTVTAPPARHSSSSVWTGSEMLVWGGYDGGKPLNSGGKYNPSTDAWTPMTTVGAPPAADSAGAVWTGTEMLVWGGDGVNDAYVNTGGRYNPTTNSWSAIPIAGAPSPRKNFTAIWTGSELIIWGGSNGIPYDDGARYNPSTNTWTAMSSFNAPSARDGYAAVWTGSKMLVWGGDHLSPTKWVDENDGALYDPQTDTWTPISTVGAPTARSGQAAVWTGSGMLIWGGITEQGAVYSNGGIFTP